MRYLRRFTYLSLPAPVVALGLCLATGALTGAPVGMGLAGAVAAAAWAIYLAERLVVAPEDAGNHPGRTRWVARHRLRLVALCGASTAGGLWLARGFGLATWAAALALVGASAAYALPLAGRRLKTLPVVKPLVVGVAWALATVALPLLETSGRVAGAGWMLTGVRLLTVAANVLVHDWADRAGDARAGAGTLPEGWQWKHLRRAAGALVVLALALDGVLAAVFGPLALVDAGGLVLFLAVLYREPPPGWRTSLALDLIVAWPLVTWLAGKLVG